MKLSPVAIVISILFVTPACKTESSELQLLSNANDRSNVESASETLSEPDEAASGVSSSDVYFVSSVDATEFFDAVDSIVRSENCTVVEAGAAYLRAHPDDPWGWFSLANFYFQDEETSLAVAAIERAIELQPANGLFIRLRAHVLLDGDLALAAFEDYKFLIEAECPFRDVFEFCAMIAMDRGDFETAARAATRAIEVLGGDDEFLMMRAEASLGAGKLDEARADAMAALDTSNDANLRAEAEALLDKLDGGTRDDE
ncbi:MAG: hypothetical protein NUW37_13315 [Planctomycetes bacterium]|nr:hypothetical protein [Planctomycetota bacterium]